MKIALTAIAVFAVVGGALAFKAQRFGSVIYTTNTPGPGAICNIKTQDFTTTTTGSVLISVSTVKNTECVATYTKSEQ